MQGLAGGVTGALVGSIFALLNGAIIYGFASVRTVSLADIIHSLLLASIVGFILSLIGVFYPAIVAARMQPVEAMRVEE